MVLQTNRKVNNVIANGKVQAYATQRTMFVSNFDMAYKNN